MKKFIAILAILVALCLAAAGCAAPAEEAAAPTGEEPPVEEAAPAEEPMMAEAQEAADTAATEAAPEEGADDKGFKSTATAAGGAGVEIGTCDDAWSRLKAAGIEAEPYDSEDAPEAGYALMTGEGEAIWNAGSGVYRVTLNGDIAEQLKELCK